MGKPFKPAQIGFARIFKMNAHRKFLFLCNNPVFGHILSCYWKRIIISLR